MEIKLNTKIDSVPGSHAAPSKAREAKVEKQEVAFHQSTALEAALKQTPDVRAEKVERARQLLDSTLYPPPIITDRIANLIAMQIDNHHEG